MFFRKHLLKILCIVLHLLSSTNCSHTEKLEKSPFEKFLQELLLQDKSSGHKLPSLNYLKEIKSYYKLSDYIPIWTNNTDLNEKAHAFLDWIEKSYKHGLKRKNYHWFQLLKLQGYFKKHPRDLRSLAVLELLLSDAFLKSVDHLQNGVIKSNQVVRDWSPIENRFLSISWFEKVRLQTSLTSSYFDKMAPYHPAYTRLQEALEKLRVKVGLDPELSLHPEQFRIGETAPLISKIKERLILEGDLKGDLNQDKTRLTNIFDSNLAEALGRFQIRHGIKATKTLDELTVQSLNKPLKFYYQLLLMNLERWRWLPQELGDAYIVVNLADYVLTVIENKKALYNLPILIGKDYRKTPVFQGKIDHFVVNPTWILPFTILKEDLLPKVRENPQILNDKEIEVFKNTHGKLVATDINAINWQESETWEAGRMPYIFIQKSGVKNALGRYKFIFPNKYDVYIHDTNAPQLFYSSNKMQSSGCIRLKNAHLLAEFLLTRFSDIPYEMMTQAFANQETLEVPLRSTFPVYVLYLTSWVASNGTLQFRPDIYNRDQAFLPFLKGNFSDVEDGTD